ACFEVFARRSGRRLRPGATSTRPRSTSCSQVPAGCRRAIGAWLHHFNLQICYAALKVNAPPRGRRIFMNCIIDAIEKEQHKTEANSFKVGDSVRVHTRVVEG